MGLENFDAYDVEGCTAACALRDPDPEGGPCVYVNIWRAEDAGVVGRTTCSFVRTSSPFYNASTAADAVVCSTLDRQTRQRQPILVKVILQ